MTNPLGNDKPIATSLSHASPPVDIQGSSNSTTETTAAAKKPPAAAMPLPTRIVLSAIAGSGAASVCHPLDVIRVQMQVHSYRNSFDAGTSIYRKSGLADGLYAGISAGILRQCVYGACKMGTFSYLLEQAKIANESAGKTDISFGLKLSIGAVSGAIGSFIGTPTEVALVRMTADSKLPPAERRNYSNVFNCLVRIGREEGIKNLWRGAAPTVARATLLSTCQMGIASEAKGRLSRSGYFGPDGQWLGGYPVLFCSTLLSSFWANVAANPFDVVKSRMQNMPIAADGTAMYKNMVDCFVKSIRAEGPMVLYAGFTPAFVKLAPYTVISLTLLDKLSKAISGKDAI